MKEIKIFKVTTKYDIINERGEREFIVYNIVAKDYAEAVKKLMEMEDIDAIIADGFTIEIFYAYV